MPPDGADDPHDDTSREAIGGPPVVGRALQLHALAALRARSEDGVVSDEAVEDLLVEELCDITDRPTATAPLVAAGWWERLATDDGYRIRGRTGRLRLLSS